MISVYTGLCLEISLYILLTWNKAEEEKFEDIKGVIRSCKSKKDDRQYNDQKKKDKQWSTIQNTTQKKVLATRTPLETRVKSGSPEG